VNIGDARSVIDGAIARGEPTVRGALTAYLASLP
jgi:hypothetical protein